MAQRGSQGLSGALGENQPNGEPTGSPAVPPLTEAQRNLLAHLLRRNVLDSSEQEEIAAHLNAEWLSHSLTPARVEEWVAFLCAPHEPSECPV